MINFSFDSKLGIFKTMAVGEIQLADINRHYQEIEDIPGTAKKAQA